jgi:nucleoid-associated protein YgaU
MTIDPAVKVAMAVCVLAAGICVAMMSRLDLRRPASSASVVQELRIRSREAASRPVAPVPDKCGTLPEQPIEPRPVERPTIVVPQAAEATPPPLAASYADTPPTSEQRRHKPSESMVPLRETAHTHRIVDGDTLESLAQRYLGSADRAAELFDANRHVLSDPRLLPIGAELRIPPNDRPQSRPQGRP